MVFQPVLGMGYWLPSGEPGSMASKATLHTTLTQRSLCPVRYGYVCVCLFVHVSVCCLTTLTACVSPGCAQRKRATGYRFVRERESERKVW